MQALVGVVIAFVLMMSMVVGFLTATLVLLAIIAWVVDGLTRLLLPRRHHRPLGG